MYDDPTVAVVADLTCKPKMIAFFAFFFAVKHLVPGTNCFLQSLGFARYAAEQDRGAMSNGY